MYKMPIIHLVIFLRVNFKPGSKIRIMAIIVIGAAIGRVKNIVKVSYCIRVWRRAGSAIGPSTIAKTAGATG